MGLAAVLVAGGCSGGAASDACGPVDPGADPGGYHALPGAAVTYERSPPSGGVHYTGPPPDPGVYTEPVDEPSQVSALENGYVVVNYDPATTTDSDLAALEGLPEEYDLVLVTPQARPLDKGSIVLTAWGFTQPCDSYDTASVRAFIRDYLDRRQTG